MQATTALSHSLRGGALALAVLVCAAADPTPALAQDAAPAGCAAFTWPAGDMQKALSGDIAKLPSGASAPHQFELALTPTEQVPFPTKPERAPKKPGTFGGFVTSDPPNGKFLQVTLSEDAWIDVAQGNALIKSDSFSGQRGCDGIRKIVRFALRGAGPITLQVSGADGPSIRVDLRGAE